MSNHFKHHFLALVKFTHVSIRDNGCHVNVTFAEVGAKMTDVGQH